ncbi:MAG: Stp1/IreP family PP2C-type Ser/Thr phosphatase [Bacteroidia bacterium]|nr:Stp1/IreP family PP2C-type Ser/Thr phosphatase [Bacteroidia bacterium]
MILNQLTCPVEYIGKSDTGRVRQINEDFLGYFDTPNGVVFVVCDGMGGHNRGDEASRIAVTAICDYLGREYYEDARKAVSEALSFANFQVYLRSLESIESRGMGTTCVLAVLRDNQLFYGHVGDSRMYLCKNHQLRQLTKDHSYVQQLIDSGIITQDEAENHPKRSVIMKAIGTSEHAEPEVAPEPLLLEARDQVLLCSDGLSSMVPFEVIQSVLASDDLTLHSKANMLIELANDAGGYDNITIQLISYLG